MANITDGVVTRHLEHCALRNLSTLTIRGRRCALERLARHLNAPVLYASAEQLRSWQTVRAKQICPATMRTELSTIREFYRWAVLEGFIQSDPTARLIMPKAPQRYPRPMHDERLAHAMHHADEQMRVILGLAAYAGLRACEIAGLDWADVELDGNEPTLIVSRGKGGKARVVPLSTTLAALLSALPYRHGPVILRADGNPGNTTAMAVTKRASRFLKEHGIPERLHAGRHRFATAAYRGTLDIRAVQSLLGHSSPTTTALYAASSNRATRAAAEAAGTFAA